MRALAPSDENSHLDRVARFLSDLGSAREAGDQGQCNKLARYLFDEIWLEYDTLVSVRPRAEFTPFFRLNHDARVKEKVEVATRMGLEPTISALTGQYVKPTTPPGRMKRLLPWKF